jgi:hypothetical protein
VLFLNNDVQLNPGAIQAGLARLWASTTVAFLLKF